MKPHTATFESLNIFLPQREGDVGTDLSRYIHVQFKVGHYGKLLHYCCSTILLTYHRWYVEVPRKDTSVGVLISTRYTFKANLTFIPGYALKEYTIQ